MKHLFERRRHLPVEEPEENYVAEDWDYDVIEDEPEYDGTQEDAEADFEEETEYEALPEEAEDAETGFEEETEYGALPEEAEDAETGFEEETEYEALPEEAEYGEEGFEEPGEEESAEEMEYAEETDSQEDDVEDVVYEDDIMYEEDWEESEEAEYADREIFDRAGGNEGGFPNRPEKLDRIMIGAAAVVLVLILVTVGVYVKTRISAAQTSELSEVGSQLDGIEIIGEKGLLAMADAEAARAAAAAVVAQEEEEEEPQQAKEYEENDYDQSVTVALKMVSVQKDLKIKFVNQDTGKLIPNVPFSVTVTDPDGKASTWSDDDMDGIIYKKSITPGTYKIAVNALAGTAYVDYTLPTETQSVEVKKDIAYQKIDVSDEVKTEAQVNTATEEQQNKNIEVESTLTDTVTLVESTETSSTYVEVSKSDIRSPEEIVLQAKAGTFLRMAEFESAIPDNDVSAGNVIETNVTLDATAKTVLTGLTAAVAVTTDAEGEILSESSDANVATVSVSDKTVTITGVSAGTANITVTCGSASAVCAVTVKTHPKDDNETKLTDKDGNQLYILENDSYREAVYADYYKDVKFFKKGDVKYTGWQTIDGKVYYYDASGNKMTGEQVIQGATYTFDSDGALVTSSGTMGIDVSKHNGSIDWEAVKNSGISYVIIRCGYRGYTQGSLIIDSKFKTNIQGATAAGLKVGVYFFSQAVDEVEAVEEASFVLDAVKGYTISYPIFLDVEYSGSSGNKGRADGLDKATRTAVCKAFCSTIQNSGYTAGIYANKTWLESMLDVSQLGSYKIWLAQYSAEPTYTGHYDLWQYKATGKVSGISGDVDLNLSYIGY